MLEASLDDEGLLENVPDNRPRWLTKSHNMDIDGPDCFSGKKTEQKDGLQKANTAMAIEIIGEFLQNKRTSRIISLVHRNLPPHWESFIQQLQMLATNSSVLRNLKHISPETLLHFPSNIHKFLSRECKTKLEFNAIMAAGLQISSPGRSHGDNWSSLWLPIDLILEDEQRNQVLEKVEDGFRYLFNRNEFIHDGNKEQNIFFLHGAFHIFRDGKEIKKITQETDKALYTKLEEVLNNEEQDVVCVFQSENKLDVIKENSYLLNCYNKLTTLSGNMVIIGSSLDDNDNHVFSQIDKSNIENVYISVMPNELEKQYKKAQEKFPSKKVYLFDAKTISYKIVENESNTK